jgi:dimethylaniline monooxygenase (N-oxide forming)
VKDVSIFEGKRVLLVGCGESGSDCALHISRVASEATMSMRNGPGYIIPRYFAGKVTDRDTTRAYHSLPKWLHAGLPSLISLKGWIESLYLNGHDDTEVLEHVGELNRKYTRSKGLSAFNRFGTKNASFVEAHVRHGLALAAGIASVEGDTFTFVDGSSCTADYVVCCTGFMPRFPFLQTHHPELATIAPRSLFKRCLLPPSHASEVGDALFFGGLVRPGIGSIPPCAEMQARYYSLLLSGKRARPSAAAIDESVRAEADADLAQFPLDAKRVGALTDYMRYLSGMAELIGCAPRFATLLLQRPALWFRVLVGPLTAAQFRLHGPGAQPAKAEAAIRAMPLMPWPVLVYELLLLVGCKALALAGASRFRPIAF